MKEESTSILPKVLEPIRRRSHAFHSFKLDARIIFKMTKNDTVVAAKAGEFGWIIVVLLAFAIFVNYVDRGNLATAAPLIKSELRLSNVEYGLLISAFFWVYVPGQVIAAWLVQRINAYRTLSIGLAIWSIATVASGFANGFVMLMVFRMVLGIGESAGFPASAKLLAQHLSPERLGKANGLVMSGTFIGPAMGTFVGGLFVAHAGWRLLFVLFGATSVLWLIPWQIKTRTLSANAQFRSTAEPSFRELLLNRQLWGASIGHFCANYPLYMMLSWLPLYLVKSQGFSIAAMAQLGGLVYGLATLTCLGGGWLADWRIAAGARTGRVRLMMICSAAVLWFVCMMVCALGNSNLAIAGLLLASVPMGLGGLNLHAIAQTLGGPKAAGKWIGIQNAIANVAGIVAPVVTAAILDWTGSYSLVFMLTGIIAMMGAVSWIFWCVRLSQSPGARSSQKKPEGFADYR